MSTEAGNQFGEENADLYRRVVSKWAKRLEEADRISDDMIKEWREDLSKALGGKVSDGLIGENLTPWVEAGLVLPSEATVERFASTATKGALGPDTNDLFRRLFIIVKAGVGAAGVVTVVISLSELLKRTAQTVAQIYDMAKDRFNKIISNFYNRSNELTGRRRWRTVGGADSRHSRLNGQIRTQGQSFSYKGKSVYGPRPSGGSPKDWSNCSCFLQFERENGRWVTV